METTPLAPADLEVETTTSADSATETNVSDTKPTQETVGPIVIEETLPPVSFTTPTTSPPPSSSVAFDPDQDVIAQLVGQVFTGDADPAQTPYVGELLLPEGSGSLSEGYVDMSIGYVALRIAGVTNVLFLTTPIGEPPPGYAVSNRGLVVTGVEFEMSDGDKFILGDCTLDDAVGSSRFYAAIVPGEPPSGQVTPIRAWHITADVAIEEIDPQSVTCTRPNI